MPIATPSQYAAMLDAAADGGYALAAVNVTSSETLNGAMRGFAEAGADGIVQVTTGAAEFLRRHGFPRTVPLLLGDLKVRLEFLQSLAHLERSPSFG